MPPYSNGAVQIRVGLELAEMFPECFERTCRNHRQNCGNHFVLKALLMSFKSVIWASGSVTFVSLSVITTEKILKKLIPVIVTDLLPT